MKCSQYFRVLVILETGIATASTPLLQDAQSLPQKTRCSGQFVFRKQGAPTTDPEARQVFVICFNLFLHQYPRIVYPHFYWSTILLKMI